MWLDSCKREEERRVGKVWLRMEGTGSPFIARTQEEKRKGHSKYVMGGVFLNDIVLVCECVDSILRQGASCTPQTKYVVFY